MINRNKKLLTSPNCTSLNKCNLGIFFLAPVVFLIKPTISEKEHIEWREGEALSGEVGVKGGSGGEEEVVVLRHSGVGVTVHEMLWHGGVGVARQ